MRRFCASPARLNSLRRALQEVRLVNVAHGRPSHHHTLLLGPLCQISAARLSHTECTGQANAEAWSQASESAATWRNEALIYSSMVIYQATNKQRPALKGQSDLKPHHAKSNSRVYQDLANQYPMYLYLTIDHHIVPFDFCFGPGMSAVLVYQCLNPRFESCLFMYVYPCSFIAPDGVYLFLCILSRDFVFFSLRYCCACCVEDNRLGGGMVLGWMRGSLSMESQASKLEY